MTSKEAVEKIKQLLFGKEQFSLVKTVDGAEFQTEGDLEVEKEIYLITPDGNMPVEDGKYEMEDGMEIEVQAGAIKSLKYATEEDVKEEELEDEVEVEEEVKEESYAEAELIDGTIVETEGEELKVGDSLFISTEDGKTAAPDGDHETADGRVISVLDGVITDITVKEKVEEEVSFDEILEVFTEAFNKLNNELEVMKEEYGKLNEKFNKFSAEPAGERLYVRQEYRETIKSKKMDKLTALAQLRNKNKITK